MLALWIALGTFMYLNIGFLWGLASWKVWQKKKRSVGGLLCFPVSYLCDEIGHEWKSGSGKDSPFIASFSTNDFHLYANLMKFIWPIKVLWNLPILLALTAYKVGCVVGKLGYMVASLMTIMTIERLSKKQPAQLPPAKPDTNPFDIDEYQSLLAKRDEVNARLRELEAHPDKDKLLQMPRRW